jgi:hypothetical protein
VKRAHLLLSGPKEARGNQGGEGGENTKETGEKWGRKARGRRGGRGEMRSVSEQSARGWGRELGWEKAGRRLNTGRWRRAEARGRSLHPAYLLLLFSAAKFVLTNGPALLGTAPSSVGGFHWVAHLCLRGSGSPFSFPQDSG